MKIISDSEIDGGYSVYERPESKQDRWVYYFFIIGWEKNVNFLLSYYHNNEFDKRGCDMKYKPDWDNVPEWYKSRFDVIYEFIFYDKEDAMAFKLRWI